MRHVPFIDATGIYNLRSVIKNLKVNGIIVIMSGINSSVYQELEKNNIIDLVSSENVLSSFDDALEHANNIVKHNDKE
jgi:SulP family sulfate permease